MLVYRISSIIVILEQINIVRFFAIINRRTKIVIVNNAIYCFKTSVNLVLIF